MTRKRIQRETNWTPEDRARHQEIRERFKDRPSVEELLESGEFSEPVPLGVYLESKRLFADLKKCREALHLSLADMAERTGMDRATLSRLENGRQPNPTLDTLARYANALGKEIVLSFKDAPSAVKGRGRQGGGDTAPSG